MYKSLEDIIVAEKEQNLPFWKIVMQDDCVELDISEEESFQRMKRMYEVMKESDRAYEDTLMSRSGLVGTDGKKVYDARVAGKLVCGDFIGRVIERAIKMGESNACMKRIVAAPTAGSCGVIPAVFITVQEEKGYTDEQMTEAMFVAAGIGGVIAHRAFLAGAAGGCQAEIGSASSMAAGAIAYLNGADATGIAHAAAIAMKNLLGLACDPVAGLVEVPCVKRNVVGAVNALTSCDMVLAGMISKIPPDEVFDAMRAVGRAMPENVRETGTGGLAATPTGIEMRERITSLQLLQTTALEDFERIDELKRERRLERRRKRRNRLLWHVALCSAVVVIFLSITAVWLKKEANEKEAEKAQELTLRVETAPAVSENLLPVNEYSRPGTELEKVKGVVIHYTGNPGTTAAQNRSYFEGLAQTKETKASSHYIIGLSGEIIQCVPLNEIAYASNQRNVDTISIECCINNEAGKFNDRTYDALVHLTAWLVGEYDLKIDDIIRHYDVTGKICPKYFVEHESAWEDFKLDVEIYIDTHGVKK